MPSGLCTVLFPISFSCYYDCLHVKGGKSHSQRNQLSTVVIKVELLPERAAFRIPLASMTANLSRQGNQMCMIASSSVSVEQQASAPLDACSRNLDQWAAVVHSSVALVLMVPIGTWLRAAANWQSIQRSTISPSNLPSPHARHLRYRLCLDMNCLENPGSDREDAVQCCTTRLVHPLRMERITCKTVFARFPWLQVANLVGWKEPVNLASCTVGKQAEPYVVMHSRD